MLSLVLALALCHQHLNLQHGGATCLQVGSEDHVICALSGGVDSAVAALLVHKVLKERLHCVFVDNGLLRYKVAPCLLLPDLGLSLEGPCCLRACLAA